MKHMIVLPELFRHYPELRQRLAWTPLARPTPVELLPRLQAHVRGPAIWLKREDRTSERFGGSEARELEFLFGVALRRGSRRLLAFGHAGSRPCLALTAFAQHFDLETILALRGRGPDPVGRDTPPLERSFGADLHRLDGGPVAFFRLLRRCTARAPRRGGPRLPFVVWPWRAALFGALGTVNAVFELQRQIRCGILPEPERLYAGTDSTATLAGLALGCELAGLRTVVVCPPGQAVRQRALRLARRSDTFLRRHVHDFPAHALLAGRLVSAAATAASPTPRQARTLLREVEGVALDSAAGAAAMALLVADCRDGAVRAPCLFWYTDPPPLQRPAASVEALPGESRTFTVPS
jgi:D-cysteine desulfhydrase